MDAMDGHDDVEMTVLTGHTHGSGVYHPAPNIEVRTGKARYGHPEIQGLIEVASA
jgi:hypothetical protein